MARLAGLEPATLGFEVETARLRVFINQYLATLATAIT